MKKILFILTISLGLFACNTTNAQSSTPRYGITTSSDNTYRSLAIGYAAYTDAVGFDSINVFPKQYTNEYKVTLLSSDSLRCGYPNNTKAKFGDRIRFVIAGPSGAKFTFGTNVNYWSTTGATLGTSNTVTTSGGAAATIDFIFNGTKWVESGRSVPTN